MATTKVQKLITRGENVLAYSIEDAPAKVTALTDNSGGSASDTIAVIGATYDQAEVRDAVASLAAKVNALETALRQSGNTQAS